MKYRESIATYRQTLQINETDALKLRISEVIAFGSALHYEYKKRRCLELCT